MRNDRDWDFESGIIANVLPMAAMAVGGDPMDVHVERFAELLRVACDVASWKNGESEEKRRDRLLMHRLDGMVEE